jgi:hypothetical protein
MQRFGRLALAASVVATGALVSAVSPVDAAPNDGGTPVFISEFHYDNAGTDAGEAIEVFGPAGTDLTGWSLVLYNGANGSSYSTRPLLDSGETSIPDSGGGFGVVVVNYPANGIQNGDSDGIALVNGAEVVQFISYEGVLTAVGGPAAGLVSVDIGVSQNGSGPLGNSLKLAGSGSCPASLTWTEESPATFDAIAPIDPSGGCDATAAPAAPAAAPAGDREDPRRPGLGRDHSTQRPDRHDRRHRRR